ncbi:MAG: nicotinate phosphoribosyltransferase, partial [Flavobacteriales bacterium]|nr:nicotinate phosphoribosyltransferase [Flavobacteriales bacterium]
PKYDHKSMGLENCTGEPLLHPVMENGKRTRPPMSVTEIAAFSKGKVDELPDEYKRFDNPHIYKVGLSKALKKQRDQLIKSMKK